MKLRDLLKENSTSKYEYGAAMLYFNFPELTKIQSFIDAQDVYLETGDKTFGLEDEAHCTLLYGLHSNVTPQEVQFALKKFKFGKCSLHSPSIFENEKYDVLKYNVQNDILNAANKELRKFPYTNDFPDYKPHLTIGYLKVGAGKKYVEFLSKNYPTFELVPRFIMYSEPSGTKTRIKI